MPTMLWHIGWEAAAAMQFDMYLAITCIMAIAPMAHAGGQVVIALDVWARHAQ